MNPVADITLDADALRELAGSFRGELIRPDDPAYDEHRRCGTARSTAAPRSSRAAAEPPTSSPPCASRATAGLPVAVRGGGHTFPGLSACDGGIVIDLGPMKAIAVDPEAPHGARCRPACCWGELDAATQAYGLARPAGS